MIKQLPTGQWAIQGVGPLLEWEGESLPVSQAVVIVTAAEMQNFIHEEAQKLADRALAILIEHQRHTLLPQQREGED